MKHLIAEFRATPGAEGRVAAMLGELAVAVREEPGNVCFDVYRTVGNAGTFVVVEAYRDEAAFRDHLDSAHSRGFNRELGPLILGDGSELTFLESLAVPAPARGWGR